MNYLLFLLLPLVLGQTVVIEHHTPLPEENALASIKTQSYFVYKIIPPRVEDPLEAVAHITQESNVLRARTEYGDVLKVVGREGNTYKVDIYLDLREGTYLVEERLPKGTDLNGFNVLNFDPLVFWLVATEGEIVTIHYRVEANAPPVELPQVVRLEGCDVRVVFEDVVRKGRKVGGKLKILVNGKPAYIRDISSNGRLVFNKEGMFYFFDGNAPFVVRGMVGACPFEGKVEGERNVLPLVVGIAFILGAAYILSRR